MAEFKVVIADVKTGKSYNRDVSGQNANALIGKIKTGTAMGRYLKGCFGTEGTFR